MASRTSSDAARPASHAEDHTTRVALATHTPDHVTDAGRWPVGGAGRVVAGRSLHVGLGGRDADRALPLDLHDARDLLQRPDDVLVRRSGDDGDRVVD